MLGHEHFEMLAALDAIGELSEMERAELVEHLEACGQCSHVSTEFADIIECNLSAIVCSDKGPFGFRQLFNRKADCRARFFARARAQGILLSAHRKRRLPRIELASAALLLLSVGGLLWMGRTRLGQFKLAAKTRSTSVRTPDIDRLLNSEREAKTQLTEEVESNQENASRVVQLEKELAERGQRERVLERDLNNARQGQSSLQAQLNDASEQSQRLKDSTEETARLVHGLQNEIEDLHTMQTQSEQKLALQQGRIRELSNEIDTQSETIEMDRRLLAAGKEIRDLMGARNLHIIDVFDVDGSGATSGRFGRVFYTEGKSLIFYAFDLGTEHAAAFHSFQAWGWRDPAKQTVRSLGIFYSDDKSQDRWVLKFDDPTVLAKIDTVFVTIEPEGGSRRPTGEKLLSAYLKGQANHP